MAGALSLYLKDRYLDEVLLAPGNLISIHLTEPGDVYVSGEVAAAEYQRRPVSFDPADDGVSLNNNMIVFPMGLTIWGRIRFFALWDASENMTYYGPLKEERDIGPLDIYVIRPGQLAVRMK